jgi:hypothetical protein
MLMYCLSDLTNSKFFAEPFNKSLWGVKHDNLKFVDSYNIIMKEMFIETHRPSSLISDDVFLEWNLKTFDKTLFLYRENTRLQSESFIFHIEKTKNEPKFKWHDKKVYDLSTIDDEKITEYQKFLDNKNNQFKELSQKHQIPLIKYEDIITNNGDNKYFKYICEYIGVDYNPDKIFRYFSSDKKYRQYNQEVNKIF